MTSNNTEKYDKLIIVPVFKTVLFPHTQTKIHVDKEFGEKLNRLFADKRKQVIGLTVKNNQEKNELTHESFYKTGTLMNVDSIQKSSDGFIINVNALERVEILEFDTKDGYIAANHSPVSDIEDMDQGEQKEITSFVKNIIHEISSNFPGSEPFTKFIDNMTSINQLIEFSIPYINCPVPEKQELLETRSVKTKSLKFLDILMKQKESVNFQIELAKKVNEKNNKNYRESLLREQLKTIQNELDENDDSSPKDENYRDRINASHMPEEVKKAALAEFKKLETAGQNNSESHVIRNYLDLLLDLPWKTEKISKLDIEHARWTLNNEHYGLEKVKERIIQHLAVMKLKSDKQGSILLLVGPPGTGKTSLGKSIAEALERKYVRISLGGVRDEAEIRGHRRTYVGALPGRIIQGMKKAGEKNPVFILDEVDKLSFSYNGDPASALLEVLDPEQNNTFSDHYLEVPYDLSDVFFIATANSLNTIPPPLLDRMEVIQISSYTNNEKFHIGKDHLLPQTLEEHGLDSEKLVLDDEALKTVIDRYTREAGVRSLKKQLSKIARVTSEKIVSGTTDLPFVVHADMLDDVLGREIIRHEEIQKENVPGVVTGLAWTPVGGEILFIEATFMGGKGGLTLTGQLGDVMKESARISLSLIRSRLAHIITNFDFDKNDLHIHVPSGATPKDGPSAGVALFTTLASLVLHKRVDSKIAMTGEITLRGTVLPVGGIKEKIIAAHRAGIKKVLLPLENEKDLVDVPDDVRDELTFVPVQTIEDVLHETLGPELPNPEVLFMNAGFNSMVNSSGSGAV
ncbi:MAG: endopeptidase La [bacterium]|nr:endopeptidase La [bacterium]